MDSFEVVVIGSGVAGGSTAYHLARQGTRVLVVERAARPATEPVASWASAGGVRRQGRHPAEALLAIESIERWPTLEAELEAEMGYQQGGNLKVGEGDAEDALIEAFVREQHANGFADVRLLDRREALAVAPCLSDTVTSASYSLQDGQADPPLTTRAFAATAERHGAVYWTDCATLGLVAEGGRVVGVRTTRGDVRADVVVLAAGAWSDELARTVGAELPIRTRALQMLLTTPAPLGTLRPVLGATGRQLSLKQLKSGELMLGGGWPGIPSEDRRSYTMVESSVAGGVAAAVAIVPAVGQQQIARRWCGLEAESFDGIPFIGPLPGIEGLIVACGFTGHGFAISPAVGRCVADQIAGRPTPELVGLDPSRIATFDAAKVAEFVREPVAQGVVAG